MKTEKFKTDEVLIALKKAKGFLQPCADILGCHRRTIQNYLKRSKVLQEAQADFNEQIKDFVEGRLLKKIEEGDTTCIIFYLKTKGRDRGYAEKTEINFDRDLTNRTVIIR